MVMLRRLRAEIMSVILWAYLVGSWLIYRSGERGIVLSVVVDSVILRSKNYRSQFVSKILHYVLMRITDQTADCHPYNFITVI